jgi:PST family polysaccharide transporter
VSVALLIVKPHPKRLLFNWQALKEMSYLGAGFSAAQIFNYVALKGDNAIVGRWLGAGALGLYTRAYGLMSMSVTIFGSAFDRVLFASLAKLQQESERLALAFRRSVAVIALIVLPMSALMFVLAPELIQVLLGPKWAGVIVPFQILAIGMLFRTGYKVTASVARATGAVYRSAWRQAVYALLVIAGSLVGQRWGVPGVSVGVLVALFSFFLLMAQLSVRLTSISWRSYLAAHVPAILLTVASGVEIWGVATIARRMGAAPPVVLVITIMICAASFLLLLLINPKLVMGEDGLWALCRIAETVPRRFLLITRWRQSLERALVSPSRS